MKLEPHWHYHWGATRSVYQPEGVEFIPMVWGSFDSQSSSFEELSTEFTLGQSNYLLGFNEPDKANQANMSVEQAIALWSHLEELNTPLVSPAATAYNNSWMLQFMQSAAENNLTIDYLALHWYSNPSPQNFLNVVDDAYRLYGLPIWITEFAVADWSMPSGINRWTEGDVIRFMQAILPELEERSYVYRYSWFSGNQPALASSALYDENQNLTQLGEIYRKHASNKNVKASDSLPHIVNQASNLLRNGNFELGNNGDWTLNNAKIATLNQIEIDEGYLAITLKESNAQITQTVSLPTELTQSSIVSLILTFTAMSTEESVLSYTLNSETYTQQVFANEEWTEYQQTFELELSSNELTLTFKNSSKNKLSLDAIMLKPMND